MLTQIRESYTFRLRDTKRYRNNGESRGILERSDDGLFSRTSYNFFRF